MPSHLNITTQITAKEGNNSDKATIELPSGKPSEQLERVMTNFEKTGEFPNLGPLGLVGSAPDSEGNRTVVTAIRNDDDLRKDTIVKLTHFKHPKGDVGAQIVIEQETPITQKRLIDVTLELGRLGVDVIDSGTGIAIANQLKQTAKKGEESGSPVSELTRQLELREISR